MTLPTPAVAVPADRTRRDRGKKPKLLLVAPYYAPSSYGGAVRLYHETLIRLQELEAVVVTQRKERGDISAQEHFDRNCPIAHGYEVRRIDTFEFGCRPGTSVAARVADAGRFFAATAAQWRSLVRAVQPDAVICGATYIAGWLMNFYRGSAPLINYLHGEELAAASSSRFLRPLLSRAQMRAIRGAIVNIAVSRYTASRASELAGTASERMVVLPNFVDTERFSPPWDRDELRGRLGWQNSRIILSLARLTPRKGIDQAIRALSELQRNGKLPPEWMHVIAGTGEQEPELRRLTTQLGADMYTRFDGFVPDDMLPGYLGAADIFLQPNRDVAGDTEGFGIVFIEASACGTPVVGGVAGGTADAIHHGITGLRVDAEDVGAIGQSVEMLVNDECLRRRMGAAGREIACREYRVGPAVKRFEAVVLDALRLNRAARSGRHCPTRQA